MSQWQIEFYDILSRILGNLYGDMGNSEIPKICKAAIRAGVNFIDTSPWYGNSEANIGKALKEDRVPRQAFYIATKVLHS